MRALQSRLVAVRGAGRAGRMRFDVLCLGGRWLLGLRCPEVRWAGPGAGGLMPRYLDVFAWQTHEEMAFYTMGQQPCGCDCP